MSATLPIPAAQYLRMSTEDQQYSIVNQKIRIQEYAQKLGFDIIKTYEDPGKSGVILKHRKGLSGLLKDVISGNAKFKAILVYDVSRWVDFKTQTKRLIMSSFARVQVFRFTIAPSRLATMAPRPVLSLKL